jgi:hypothetical protein
LFICFYRKPAKKETAEENFVEKQNFKQSWIILMAWLVGTIAVFSFEINVLWVFLFVVAGAYIASASRSSEKAFVIDQSRVHNPSTARAQKGNQRATSGSTTLPDFGDHLASTGTPKKTMLIYTSWEMDVLSVVGVGQFCTTRIQPHNDLLYCATFDFEMDILGELLKAATQRTFEFVTQNLLEDPSSTRNLNLPDPINVGIGAVLGEVKQGFDGAFIPLLIVEVFGFESRGVKENVL